MGLLSFESVALLDSADELIAFARDHVPVVVREFAPLFSKPAAVLFPLAFYLIPALGWLKLLLATAADHLQVGHGHVAALSGILIDAMFPGRGLGVFFRSV